MPDKVFLTRIGRIETCRACAVSFDMRPGESTSALIHRYTSWREAHNHDPGDETGSSPDVPVPPET